MKIISFLIISHMALQISYSQVDSLLIPIQEYKPFDEKLFETIVNIDQAFFNAYNNCDLEKQAEICANDIEFFHDQGGLMTSKEVIIEGTKNNICGKVIRTVLPESIEVYPIKDYGAMEIGCHSFFNKKESNELSTPSKFIAIWQFLNNKWRLAKMISLH